MKPCRRVILPAQHIPALAFAGRRNSGNQANPIFAAIERYEEAERVEDGRQLSHGASIEASAPRNVNLKAQWNVGKLRAVDPIEAAPHLRSTAVLIWAPKRCVPPAPLEGPLRM